MCPVNSQNEEKLAGQGEARLRLLTNATYPCPSGGLAAVHSVSDCQRHTLVPNMRSTIIVRLHEEAKSQAQPERGSLCVGGGAWCGALEHAYSQALASDKIAM